MAPLPAKWTDALLCADCLEAAALLPAASLDLVYIDPPFNTGKLRTGRALPLGPGGRKRTSDREDSLFYLDRWEGSLSGYLSWLEARIRGFVRLLKPTGSILVHSDHHASHYVKVMLDGILGRGRFVNEIVWHYQTGGSFRNRLSRKYDSILWYARGPRYVFNAEAAALPRNLCRLCGGARRKNHMRRQIDGEGKRRLVIRSGGREYCYDEEGPAPPCDVWLDISQLHQRDPERTGYPSQKPLKLLERLIRLCSPAEGSVADFFIGSGTAAVAAAALGRRWFGCDQNPEAIRLAAERLQKRGVPFQVVEKTNKVFQERGS